jgi:site-specific DNA recombinase
MSQKARQGLLTGSLGWGLLKGEAGIAVPDPDRAPYVLGMFKLYATGEHSDRTVAEWLNVKEQRTVRGRPFTTDTVREMLCNAAYCGFVSARRDRSKAIKGQHEAIVPEELFDRVQDIRRQRSRTQKPRRPSERRYLLRGLARCRRCHGNMQGTTTGKKNTPRYYCATRRTTRSCDQPLVTAEEVERQLVDFIEGFALDRQTTEEILRRLAEDAGPEGKDVTRRRAALEERLRRMRDLYELGDLERGEYVARRNAINAELNTLAPAPIPDLDQARKVLGDFSISWREETEGEAKPVSEPDLRERLARRAARGRRPAKALVSGVL